ncbi:hypothetical protein ACSVDA_03210 [Cytobacillus sp. Hm23]
MADPKFIMKKMWTDVDFFEVNLSIFGSDCNVNLDIYTDNEELEELRRGIELFSTQLGENEFIWTTGNRTKHTTHFLSMRFFLQDKRGIIGIEFKVDNKSKPPYTMYANFYIITEINQIDELTRKIEKFIRGEIVKVESLK